MHVFVNVLQCMHVYSLVVQYGHYEYSSSSTTRRSILCLREYITYHY